jgi:Txe/YoeB family toxin of Txe-Axe toxin-antitoxin module
MKKWVGRTEALLETPLKEVKRYGFPGIGKPERLTDDDRFPGNITTLSDKEVRNLLSFWTSHYAYANYRLGRANARKLVLTRLLDRRRAILFEKFKPEKKTSDWSQAIEGRINQDKRTKYLSEELAKAEGIVEILQPLVWDFKAYAEAASREMTARYNEYELLGRTASRRKNFDST